MTEAGPARSLDSEGVRLRARYGGRARSASSIALAAFAVHQFRYILASGHPEDGLAGLGHAYLGHLPPLLLGLALAAVVAGLTRGREPCAAPRHDRRVRAVVVSLGIVAVFCSQELIEGALIAGHVGGLATIFSSGGWAAMPLAATFGLLAALVDRGIEMVENGLANPPMATGRALPVVSMPQPTDVLGRRPSPLALGLARRPPPALS